MIFSIQMLRIIKDVRDIKRFNQILAVLFEEGFDFLLDKIKLSHRIPITKRIRLGLKNSEKAKPEVRLRKTFERLGPAFIKLGQILSLRPDLIPKEYCKELENLQDSVPEFSFEDVEKAIEKELGNGINDIFREFEKKPIASASISQVHKAVLKSGERVAVKVQRPNVRKTMETDIEIMHYFATLIEEHFEGIRRFKPTKIVDDFKEWTEKELDFRLEARNAARFYQNFKGSKSTRIPKVYDNLTSERVLTLEFVYGIELHKIRELQRKHMDFGRIIRNGIDSIMTQVFIHGVFHADPHPGNIIVMADGTIAFVDFGIVGYFDERLKDKCVSLLCGFAEQDEEMIVQSLIDMGMSGDDINYEELKSEISFAILPLKDASIKDVKLSRVFEEVIEIAVKHNLKVPISLVLFGKTIITLEGIALVYDDKFRILDSIKPFVNKLVLQRTRPSYIMKSFVHNINRYKRFAEEFPEKADKFMDKIKEGTIKLDIKDENIKRLSLEIDRSSNRISYALLITAFLLTSAILFIVEKGPSILGIPFLSLFSFAFASFFAFILFVSIIKERFRHWR